MLVNLSDVLTSAGKITEAEIPVEMTVFESRMGRFPILEAEPVRFVFTNQGIGKANVAGSTSIVLGMQCDRCLKEVTVKLNLEFTREITSPDSTDSDSEDQDDRGVMEGYQLNVEALIYNEILINQPEKVLCKPDCKGICKQCGNDLNDGECGCDTFVPDPRMAVLQDIFNANKEV